MNNEKMTKPLLVERSSQRRMEIIDLKKEYKELQQELQTKLGLKEIVRDEELALKLNRKEVAGGKVELGDETLNEIRRKMKVTAQKLQDLKEGRGEETDL